MTWELDDVAALHRRAKRIDQPTAQASPAGAAPSIEASRTRDERLPVVRPWSAPIPGRTSVVMGDDREVGTWWVPQS